MSRRKHKLQVQESSLSRNKAWPAQQWLQILRSLVTIMGTTSTLCDDFLVQRLDLRTRKQRFAFLNLLALLAIASEWQHFRWHFQATAAWLSLCLCAAGCPHVYFQATANTIDINVCMHMCKTIREKRESGRAGGKRGETGTEIRVERE